MLLCIAHDPGVRLRDIAARTGITGRTAYSIVTDLTEARYVVKHKDGRRNRYQIQAHLPLPQTGSRERTIGEILALLTGADDEATASSDAEGTLGGLVTQARHIGFHLAVALRAGGLCSNDPVCAQHSAGEGMEGRWLNGAACHGCALIVETSCEMRNDYLDRALVVPTLSVPQAAFFPPVP